MTTTGTNGSDLLIGTGSDDTINGGNGNDVLFGEAGDDILDGGNGNDDLDGGDGDDILYGGNGDDTLEGGAGDDTLYGGNGKDTAVFSGVMASYLFELQDDGGIRVHDTTDADGTDLVYNVSYFQFADGAVDAADLPFGEIPEPPDTADYSWTTQGVTVDLIANTASGPEIPGGTETLADSIVNVIGGSGDDVLRGDSGDNQLFGGDGNDLLTGGLGGNDLFDGGNGLDRVSFAGAANSVNVQLAAGIATIGGFTKTLQSIELVRGTNQNDTYDATGFSGASVNAGSNGTFNEFEGLGGDDTITGNGNTRVSYVQADAGVTVVLGAGGSGSAVGTAPGDVAGIGIDMFVGGVSRVRGSEFGDDITGNGADNILEGQGGNDVLRGGAGNDTLNGGAGIDIALFSGNRAAYTFPAGPMPGTQLVNGPDGTDTTSSVELLQFADAYQMGYAITPIDLTNFGLIPGFAIFGRAVSDNLTMDTNANGRLINLGGDVDTLTLQELGSPVYNLNLLNVENLLSTGGIDTVNLQNAANGMTVDLGAGFDTLNLANDTNAATTHNVEFINGGTGDDTITFFADFSVVNQEIHLGLGTNELNLGTSGDYTIAVSGANLTVNGTAGDENVQLINTQGGTLFDLGAGDDSLTLWNDFVSANDVTVQNVEHVFGSGFQSDQITIAGNSAGVTTVTAAGGADIITASADVDHIRFTNSSDSGYDLEMSPGGGLRDVIHGFNADQDMFVLAGIAQPDFVWELLEDIGGDQATDIVRIDLDNDTNWDMAIELQSFTGTLTDDNFWVV